MTRLAKELSSLTARLVRIKSETGNASTNKECLDFVKEYLKEFKDQLHFYNYSYKGAPNLVVSTAKTKRPDIILSGHVDVVQGTDKQFVPQIKGNRLYGRGSMDMKGGVATILKLFRDMVKEEGGGPTLALMLTGDEETGSVGAKYLTREQGWRAGFVLIPEGKPYFKITSKDKGGCWVKMVATGKPAHAAYPWLGENAIKKLVVAYNKIDRLFPPPADKWQSSMSLTHLTNGGGQVTRNQVPAKAEAILDIRYTQKFARRSEEVVKKLEAVAPEVSFELLRGYDVLYIPNSNRHIKKLLSLASEQVGKRLTLGFNHGGSDGSAFASYDVPAMTSGIVGANHHGDNEYVLISSLTDYYHIARGFIEQWKG